LFGSKESESIINGLNIMGSLFGFGADLSKTSKQITENIPFFKRNSSIIPIAVWEKVFSFQESWDITIQIASILILQLALPSDYAHYIYKKRKQRIKLNHDTSRSFELHDQGKSNERNDQHEQSDKENGAHTNQPLLPRQASRESKKLLTDQGLDLILRQVAGAKQRRSDQLGGKASFSLVGLSVDQTSEDGSIIDINWIEKNFQEEEIRQLMNLFKMHFSLEENKWTSPKIPDRNLEIISDGADLVEVLNNQNNKVEDLPSTSVEKPPNPNITIEIPVDQKLDNKNTSCPPPPPDLASPEQDKPILTNFTIDIQLPKDPLIIKPIPKMPKSTEGKSGLRSRPVSPKEDIKSLEQRITLLQEKARPVSPPQILLSPGPNEAAFFQENPVKRIIKMKHKLIDKQLATDHYQRDQLLDRKFVNDREGVFMVPTIHIEELQGVTKSITKRSDLSSSSTKEREFQGPSRRSVNRKEINRILSSHFIKPPTDSLLKTISSPKNLACINEQISELLKGKTNSASKVRLSSKQRGKNSSVCSLREKKDKTTTVQTAESIAERPSLPKKSSNLLTDLKKKMLGNLSSSKKVISGGEKHSKKNMVAIALKSPEVQVKLSTGQHRGTTNLLRYKPQD
jgi:hypothetical protein